MRIVLVSVLLLLGVTGWLTLGKPHGAARQTQRAAPSASIERADTEPEAGQEPHTHAQAASGVRAKDPSSPYGSDAYVYQLERQSTNAKQLLDALLPLMQQGNGAATHALDRLFLRCTAFTGDVRTRAKVTAPAGSEDAVWQSRLIEQGRTHCDDHRMYDTQGFFAAYRQASQALRALGEEIAVAKSIEALESNGSPLSVEKQAAARSKAWELVRGSDNPYAVEAALSTLAELPDSPESPTGRLDREVSEVRVGENAYVRTMAAMWFACELGADCRPFGVWQQSTCLHQRNCAPQLPLQDFIRERMLTPPQYAAMQRYLDVIRAERARH